MRTLKGLAALLALTALVVGIPAALILLVGNPIPSTAELQQALTGIDFGGTFLMGTVPVSYTHLTLPTTPYV